jgi:hypothetical protein
VGVGDRPISAHELASYAYCPRAWWYDHHPEEVPQISHDRNQAGFARGDAFQDRLLASHVRAQQTSVGPYVVAAGIALALLVVVLWWNHFFGHSSFPGVRTRSSGPCGYVECHSLL